MDPQIRFTPQQLTGGPRYHHRVRIGNWSEDIELEEIKLKDYLKKKETGTLMVTSKQQTLAESLDPVELSPSEDGILHFGHRVLLANHQVKGFLSANPNDPVQKSYPAWMATASRYGDPCLRNVFELERVDMRDGFSDDVIHFGQTLRIKLHPFAKIAEPAYLHSELATPMVAAKFSRHQEVTVIAAPCGEAKWQLMHPDPAQRPDVEGEPVPAGCPVLLRHVQTGNFLASDLIPYHNIFGKESEVHCHPYYSLSKGGVLENEAKGDAESVAKSFGLHNLWTMLTATHGLEGGAEMGLCPGGDSTQPPGAGV